VLGDMLELGPDQVRFHAEIGAHARSSEVDLLVTVGPLAARMGPPFGSDIVFTETAAEAAEVVAASLQPGDTVLVKASRGVGLEVVAERLASWTPAAAPADPDAPTA
jgi:UDP-N-acetylmuramoyl-tripeptide--D-alanyl-D-alanine ligase